jgi:hypothetical protein
MNERSPSRRWVYATAVLCLALAGAAVLLLTGGHAGRNGKTGKTASYRRNLMAGGLSTYHGPAAAVPEFYVVIAYTGTPGQSGTNRAEVRRTGSGAVTAALPPLPVGWYLGAGVSASTSNREFFVKAATTARCSAGSVTRFYRFFITGTGQISGFGPVGPEIRGLVGQFSASPDGSRMAFTTQACGIGPGGANAQQPAIEVMALSTGDIVTWRNTVTTATPGRVAGQPGPLSWTADGAVLAVDYHWRQSDGPQYFGVLGLDAKGSGGSLQAHSRVLLSQGGDCGTCVYKALIDPAGTALTAVAMQQLPASKQADEYREWVISIPLVTSRTGSSILFTATRSECGADPVLYGGGSAGNWILESGVQLGWVGQGHLISLSPGTGLLLRTSDGGCSLLQSGPLVAGIAW